MKKNFYAGLMVVSLMVNGIMICKISSYNTKLEEINNTIHKEYTVSRGETLWDIASQYTDSKDVRKKVYEIKEVNKLKTSTIYEDQVLIIPTERGGNINE